MNVLSLLLLLVLLASVSEVFGRGRRCRSSTQCDFQSVCDDGFCFTVDEMFDKYGMNYLQDALIAYCHSEKRKRRFLISEQILKLWRDHEQNIIVAKLAITGTSNSFAVIF
ncbi:unnamed protein product [Caenorhabditis sp. 36 PRJEB53466]|nr:unnamed protein product [Caenorhabditis sp. 36 PRJEB53466]